MTAHANNAALLPAGLGDLLPPEASAEAANVERLMTIFAGHGFDRVKPPLVEFETSLLSGAGADMAEQTFRMMDPLSRRMLGLRADMTPQVARIAATRLANAPRPLRLSYAGQVLQVHGSQLRPQRQFGQIGCELIGEAGAAADAEVIGLAAEALMAAGVTDLSIDLNLPTLVDQLASALGLDAARIQELKAALDRKDERAVAAAGAGHEVFHRLLAIHGPAAAARAQLAAIDLPARAAEERAALFEVLRHLETGHPGLTLTLDPVEHRGFEYQSGVSFVLFARGLRGELGRGGRYLSRAREPATGFTLYTDTLARALPLAPPSRRVYLPMGLARSVGARLRAEGWVTVAALNAAADPWAEARRLGCGHVLIGGRPEAVEGKKGTG
jgi:ATP phosphoribosyltransferase regulatory subunit